MASNDAVPMPAGSDWKDRANSSRSHRPAVVSYFEWVQDLQQLFWEEEEVMQREY